MNGSASADPTDKIRAYNRYKSSEIFPAIRLVSRPDIAAYVRYRPCRMVQLARLVGRCSIGAASTRKLMLEPDHLARAYRGQSGAQGRGYGHPSLKVKLTPRLGQSTRVAGRRRMRWRIRRSGWATTCSRSAGPRPLADVTRAGHESPWLERHYACWSYL